MIDFLANLIFNFLNYLISLLPTGEGFGSGMHSAFQTLGGVLKLIDSFLPLSVLKSCLVTILIAEGIIFAFKNFNWIKSHIPFLGGK